MIKMESQDKNEMLIQNLNDTLLDIAENFHTMNKQQKLMVLSMIDAFFSVMVGVKQ